MFFHVNAYFAPPFAGHFTGTTTTCIHEMTYTAQLLSWIFGSSMVRLTPWRSFPFLDHFTNSTYRYIELFLFLDHLTNSIYIWNA